MDRYFKIYLQNEKDGEGVVDTIQAFGMYCMENPFKTCEEVKEPTKRTWYDEHGDDEYIPPKDGIFLAAYENKVRFGFRGDAYGANERLKAFLEYLRGGMFKMYCEFNKVGRRHVRLKSVSPTLYRSVYGNEDILTIYLTFKFNDPKKDVIPVKGENGGVTQLMVVDD